ncbi:unnamed protein product, partial [Hydatigera taeniaeformis]|uniref:UDENN domain-containing protein n=1 Tax=Hydatigena taeniaeformis TaxID=6205 RepID=A0A0R3WSL8_HYDTA
MDALASYGGSSEEESSSPQNSPKLIASSSLVPSVNPTAPVEIKEDILKIVPVDPYSNELTHNPRYDQLFAPQVIIYHIDFPLVGISYSEDPSVLGVNKGRVVGSPERVDDSEG